jgi:putative membrane protein
LPDLISYLTAAEAASLQTVVARVEGRTGVQVVPAVIGKADTYPEIPWEGFAIGSAFSALALVAADSWHPAWVTASTAILHATVILGAGAACALAAAFLTPAARLLLRGMRADEEVRQYAASLFLRRAVFATRERTGVLVLVSLFERRIEIVADTGFAGRIGDADWHGVIARMTPHLRNSRPFEALRDALDAIDALLASRNFRAGGGSNELPDDVIQERGV